MSLLIYDQSMNYHLRLRRKNRKHLHTVAMIDVTIDGCGDDSGFGVREGQCTDTVSRLYSYCTGPSSNEF